MTNRSREQCDFYRGSIRGLKESSLDTVGRGHAEDDPRLYDASERGARQPAMCELFASSVLVDRAFESWAPAGP